MKKNVGSQVVGAQLNSKTDGSAVTGGTTTVYVTGDGGTQATGSVGSGACTHEGQGFWTYVPAQAETNYDHVAFTFANTSAVSATVQVYTSFPQTGDNFARLGAPAGASVSADVAAIKSDSGAIKTKTDFLPSATAGAAGGVFIAGTNAATTITTALTTTFTGNLTGNVGGNVTGSVGSVATGGISSASFAAGAINAAAIASDAITDAKVASDVTIASVTGAVGSVTGNVGGNVTGTVGSVVGAVGSVTGNVGGNVVGTVASVVGAVGSVTGNVGGNVTGSVGSLATQAKADVNAEVDTAIADAALATATNLATVSAVTNRLDTAMELDVAAGSPTQYRFTTNALEQAPGAGSNPTAAEIADAVWDESLAAHQIAGSTGEGLADAGAAGNPWNSVLEGSLTAEDLLRICAAVAAGKTTIVTAGNGTATVVFRDASDASNIVSAQMTGSERTSVTLAP